MITTISSIYNPKTNILLIALLLTVSCTNTSDNIKTNENIESQKQLILNIHDDLMLDMGELKNLTKALDVIVEDSVQGAKTQIIASVAIEHLQMADKAMWDWMHQFDIAFQGDKDSLTLNYFLHQYKLIKEVQVLFDESKVEAEELIPNYARAQ